MSRNTNKRKDGSIPGWYITFQQDLLATAPRPGEIDKETAKIWHKNRAGMKKGLKEYFCPPEKSIEFPVFKTIKLGTHKSVNDLRQSLKDRGSRISSWGDKILGKITLTESEMKVTLHVATVKELTGKDWATNRGINEAIRSKGYDLCPAEAGPQLRLQYTDQPKGEWLRIAMKPIADSDGDLDIFSVFHVDGERCLYGGGGHPDGGWSGDDRFVFVSKKAA
jgi:hypothetical protein